MCASTASSCASPVGAPKLAPARASHVPPRTNKPRNQLINKLTPLIRRKRTASQHSLARERHVPLQLVFRIEDRLDPGDRQPPIAHASLQDRRELGDALIFGGSPQPLPIHEE